MFKKLFGFLKKDEAKDEVRVCKKCNEEVIEKVNATVKLPQLYLDGNIDLISKDNDCMMKADYYDDNKTVVDKFMEEYKASVEYVNADVDSAAELVEAFGIFKAAVAKKAIPECNITLVSGSDMKTKVENYLKVLYGENPNAVGGKMPDEKFYVTDK